MDWLPGRRRTDDPTAPERDLGAEVDQLRWQVDDLRSEMAALRAQVGRLLDHIERLSTRQQPTVIKPTPAAAPAQAPAASIRRGGVLSAPSRPSPAARSVAPPAERQAAAAQSAPAPDAILEAYRAAAADLAGAGETFMAEHQPKGLARATDGGWSLEDDARSAFLWAVRHGQAWLMLPGYRAVKDWRSHFAYQREQNAADYFGEAFDLDPAPGRFDVAPAVGHVDGGVLRLKRRGLIRGFRS